MPSWVGKAAGGSLESYAGANPFKFLQALAQMSSLEQQIYLEMIGEGLKVRQAQPPSLTELHLVSSRSVLIDLQAFHALLRPNCPTSAVV